jgi:hypothetical protein
VAERPSPGVEPGVYRVNVAGGSVKKLFDYVARGRLPEIAASPDGRTLLTLATEMVTPSVTARDLSRAK